MRLRRFLLRYYPPGEDGRGAREGKKVDVWFDKRDLKAVCQADRFCGLSDACSNRERDQCGGLMHREVLFLLVVIYSNMEQTIIFQQKQQL